MKRTEFYRFTALVVLALFAGGCESRRQLPLPAQSDERTAEAGPTAVLPDGFTVQLELATTDELRGQGLMYRESLPPGQGMLFLFPEPGEHPFWMKNTLIPLDMIWLDTSRKIVAILADVQPCRADPCPTYPPNAISSYVLELAAGEAKTHGLSVGDALELRGIGAVPIR